MSWNRYKRTKVDTFRKTEPTKMVSTTAAISTGYHGRAVLFSLIRCLMISEIFIQNARAGPAIRNVDKNNEEASGPKTSLPPNKNVCIIQNNNNWIYQILQPKMHSSSIWNWDYTKIDLLVIHCDLNTIQPQINTSFHTLQFWEIFCLWLDFNP